ncbi:MAG: carboxypeptidase M32 [Pseudomonadota bacterium]
MAETAFDALMAHDRATGALREVAGLLSWDQETMMPKRGATQRAEQAAALAATIHARDTDPRLGAWLEAAEASEHAPESVRALALLRRRHDRSRRLPARLVETLAAKTSAAQVIWADARRLNAPADFLPSLAEIIDLKREEAQCLANGGSLYDALLDDFEQGLTMTKLKPIFAELRAGLTALLAQILPRTEGQTAAFCPVPAAEQLALGPRIAEAFGYDLAAGRVDLSVHPFCSGSGGDVRITTRIDPEDPLTSLYSLIHEMGHAVYEQRIDPALRGTPLGVYASMGIHESQSRLFENQIGRSRSFAVWLHREMEAAFGPTGLDGPDALWRSANRVTPGFIRTDADELHYNLHILMRTDLEHALIEGDLDVGDLEAAWNDRFAGDFGRTVPSPADGFLQDVHWSVGIFGYFPTYTLGNIYAACLWDAIEQRLPSLDADLASGNLARILDWLGRHVHRQGARLTAEALIEAATGSGPDAAPLLSYLAGKANTLYPA